MRNLKARLERLEAVTPKPPEVRVIVVCYAYPRNEEPGELRGFNGGDRYIARLPGESEAALKARAVEAARRPDRVAVLIEDRAPYGC